MAKMLEVHSSSFNKEKKINITINKIVFVVKRKLTSGYEFLDFWIFKIGFVFNKESGIAWLNGNYFPKKYYKKCPLWYLLRNQI